MGRYETPDHEGETRRERNARYDMSEETPDIVIPPAGEYLLEWLWDIMASQPTGENGPNPISCTELANWSLLTGNALNRREVAILRRLDSAYRNAVAKEREAQVSRRAG